MTKRLRHRVVTGLLVVAGLMHGLATAATVVDVPTTLTEAQVVTPAATSHKTVTIRARITLPEAVSSATTLIALRLASSSVSVEVSPDGSLSTHWNGGAVRQTSAAGVIVPGEARTITLTYDGEHVKNDQTGVTIGTHVWVDDVCVIRDLALMSSSSSLDRVSFGFRDLVVDALAVDFGELPSVGYFPLTVPAGSGILLALTKSATANPVSFAVNLGMVSRLTTALSPIALPSDIGCLTLAFKADLPETGDGTLCTLEISKGTTTGFGIRVSRRSGALCLSYTGDNWANTTEQASVPSVSGSHIFHLTYDAAGGTSVFIDGARAIDAPSVKWSGSTVTAITFGTFASAWLQAVNLCSLSKASVPSVFFDGLVSWSPVLTAANPEIRLWAYDRLGANAPDYAPPAVRLNGAVLTPAAALETLYFYGRDPSAAADLSFAVASIEPPASSADTVTLTLDTGGAALANGTISLLGRARLDEGWQRLETRRAETFDGGFSVDARSAPDAFFTVRAEFGDPPLGRLAAWAPQNEPAANPVVTAGDGAAAAFLTFALDGAAEELGEDGRLRLTLALAGDGLRAGDVYTLTVGGTALTTALAATSDGGRLVFDGLPAVEKGTTAVLRGPTPAIPARVTVSGAALRDSVSVRFARMLADLPSTEIPNVTCTDGNKFRIPALAATPDGATVVAAYDCRYNGPDLGNEINSKYYSRIDIAENVSTDHGQTWTTPVVAIDVPNHTSTTVDIRKDIGDPSMLYDPATETFWLMAITGGGLIRNNNGNDCVLYTRGKGVNDRWREWTGGPAGNMRSVKQMLLAKHSWNPAKGILQGPGHGIVLRKACGDFPAGTLVFPMQYFGNANYQARCFAAFSTDHGATWTPSQLTMGGVNAQENCITQLDDGSLLMMCKSDNKREFFRSVDGDSWTRLAPFTPSTTVQGSCLRIGTHADGASRYAMALCSSPSNDRSHLKIVFGRDLTADAAHQAVNTEGVAWDCGELMIHKDATGGMGYNSLCLLDAETLGILYETRSHIYFERIPIATYLTD